MRIPRLTHDVAFAAVQLVDASRPPSHDELSRLIAGVNLSAADPGLEFGKVKRMRAVMDHAMTQDRVAGAKLVSRLIAAVRSNGGFRAGSHFFIGPDIYTNLRDAYRAVGYELDESGHLCPRLLESVPATESHEVLRTYVQRIRSGAMDAPLVTGTGKDLLEATARKINDDHGATYAGTDFPGTLFHAFRALGMEAPPQNVIETLKRDLHTDPRKRVEQALYILGCEVNRLRNAEGTGHGRPWAAKVAEVDARTAAQAMALISERLLSPGSPTAAATERT